MGTAQREIAKVQMIQIQIRNPTLKFQKSNDGKKYFYFRMFDHKLV